jgi:hypothetical protein
MIDACAGEAAAGVLAAALVHVAGLGEVPSSPFDLPPAMRPALASSGRPANRPERRLQAIAALFVRARGDIPSFIRESVALAASAKGLVAAWQVSRQGLALIGPDRGREVVLNLVLPFATGNTVLRERALALLEELGPSPAYGKTAFLESHLRPGAGRRLVRRAVEQQGLLAFLGEWCSRGGCGRCPLS